MSEITIRAASPAHKNKKAKTPPKNLWMKASRKFQIESVASERAHGDGLSVDFDTPEAF